MNRRVLQSRFVMLFAAILLRRAYRERGDFARMWEPVFVVSQRFERVVTRSIR